RRMPTPGNSWRRDKETRRQRWPPRDRVHIRVPVGQARPLDSRGCRDNVTRPRRWYLPETDRKRVGYLNGDRSRRRGRGSAEASVTLRQLFGGTPVADLQARILA